MIVGDMVQWNLHWNQNPEPLGQAYGEIVAIRGEHVAVMRTDTDAAPQMTPFASLHVSQLRPLREAA